MKRYTLLSLLLWMTTLNVHAQNWDINTLEKINVHRNKDLDPGFKFITNTFAPVSVAAPLSLGIVALIKKDSSLAYKSFFIVESLAVSTFVTVALKYTIRRERPFETYSFIQQETEAGSLSFPSGHTSTAFAAATSLSIAFPKWYVIAPSFLWASAVGYSRMHLGVHYPSDVLAGALIGSGATLLSHAINRKLFERKQKTSDPLYINLW